MKLAIVVILALALIGTVAYLYSRHIRTKKMLSRPSRLVRLIEATNRVASPTKQRSASAIPSDARYR
jgi:uncharacterized protein YlaI